MSVAEVYGFNFKDEPCELFLQRKWPCNKCLPCLRRRQKDWVTRLVEHLRSNDDNYFVTFTYDEENAPVDEYGQYCFNKQHFVKLHRDLRKRFQNGRFRNIASSLITDSPEYIDLPLDHRFQYYLTTEYGPNSTQRPHAHAVYYNLGVDIWTAELLFRSMWPYGFISIFPAKEGAAGYISKYLVKDSLFVDSYHEDTRMSPFSLMSKGLGKEYIERMKDWHQSDTSRFFYQYHGEKKRLSRYYRDRIYSDEVRTASADRFSDQVESLVQKYTELRITKPNTYKRLMEERQKYYDDLYQNERWNMLKHQSLK